MLYVSVVCPGRTTSDSRPELRRLKALDAENDVLGDFGDMNDPYMDEYYKPDEEMLGQYLKMTPDTPLDSPTTSPCREMDHANEFDSKDTVQPKLETEIQAKKIDIQPEKNFNQPIQTNKKDIHQPKKNFMKPETNIQAEKDMQTKEDITKPETMKAEKKDMQTNEDITQPETKIAEKKDTQTKEDITQPEINIQAKKNDMETKDNIQPETNIKAEKKDMQTKEDITQPETKIQAEKKATQTNEDLQVETKDMETKEDIQPKTMQNENKKPRRPRAASRAPKAAPKPPRVKQSLAEKKRKHRLACENWHARWISKGVPRDPAAAVPKKKATSRASAQASAASPETQITKGKKDHGKGKTAVKKDQTGKKDKPRDRRTVKFEYIRGFLANYASPVPETKQERMSKANKAWMQSTLRAELMSKPGKQTL